MRAGATRVEAYSWGGLTGRSQSRALWLLVLPFSLVNLAGWMTWDRSRTAHRVLVRVAGLAMTLLYVLFAAAVSMDFVAYQCAGAPGCAAASWPVLGDLGPARRVVVGAAGPLAVVGLLAALTWTSRRRYEQWDTPGAPPRVGVNPATRGLADPEFWRGQGYAASLARVHHFAGLVTVALLLSATAWSVTDSPLGPSLTFLCGGLLVVAVVLAMASSLRAPIPGGLLLGGGGALVLLAGIAAWTGAPTGQLPRPLPGILLTFDGVLAVLYLAVIGLLFGWHAARERGRWRRLRERLTAFAVCVLAGLLAPAVLAGAALWVAQRLGTTASVGQAHDAAILYPQPYAMLARAMVLLILLAIVIALVAAAVSWFTTGQDSLRRLRDAWAEIEDDRPVATDTRWLRQVRTALRMPRASLAAVEWTVWTLASLITMGAVVYSGYWAISWVASDNPQSYVDVKLGLPLPPLELSIWVLTLLPVLAGLILRQGLRNPSARRRIAIAWDVATFWPRSFHPLCPPSYAERAIPEIQTRLRRVWAADGSVVLLAHSQGAVLATAAVAGLPEPGRLAVITYGNPTQRLYARHFPSYVDTGLLAAVTRRVPRWRNFYRDTDYVGHRMFDQKNDVDVYLPDPATDRFHPGDQLPEIRGHSELGYRRQSGFIAHFDAVVADLRAANHRDIR